MSGIGGDAIGGPGVAQQRSRRGLEAGLWIIGACLTGGTLALARLPRLRRASVEPADVQSVDSAGSQPVRDKAPGCCHSAARELEPRPAFYIE